jgi:hypothetical protein
VQPTASTQSATLTGVIVGMEEHAGPVEKEAHQLNLLCAEGMRSVPLAQIQRIRFLDPVVDADFRRALDVLASAHDMQKKVVSLKFNGQGKRTVQGSSGLGSVENCPLESATAIYANCSTSDRSIDG